MAGRIETIGTGEMADLHGELDSAIADRAKFAMLIVVFDPAENPDGYAWGTRTRGQCSSAELVYIWEALKLDALNGAMEED